MNRFALILEASRADPSSPIDGCALDAAGIASFLRTPHGGAWEDKEIKVVNNVWKFEINQYKPLLNNADFAFVSFSGHGRMVRQGGTIEQRLLVGAAGGPVEISIDAIVPESRKAVVWCDACREVTELPDRYQRLAKSGALIETFNEAVNRANYRRAYERAIHSSPEGKHFLFSCGEGELAGEIPGNGGLFTQSMLKTAIEWCRSSHQAKTLTIGATLADTSPIVTNMAANGRPSRPQHPQVFADPRVRLTFPMAVNV